jgi:adenine-specific DNA-methyltransferase
MSKYNELVKKLKEIFQIDRPELDFGIYRILNAKGDEINNYLENTLKKKISDALATAGNANKEELEKQLAGAIKGAEALGVDSETIPKVKDLRNQILVVSQGANEHENAVFTHMLSFFSRYYDSGDFVSKRRYKGDTYAIPYAGEEVMLHWANKDQYYIKSGENFANYSFKLEDGRKVSFKLLAADTAKDNRKDNDTDRRFVLIEPHVRKKYDEEGNEYEEEYSPVTENKPNDVDELIIQFEYKVVKKGTKQEAMVEQALQNILSSEIVQSNWLDITSREPTEKNPNRTLLEKHLTTYTQRNTADYFIHKDLGGFLSNELDFYIKNEVMNLDNVQNAEVFADIEKQLRMIQCLRSISKDIIAFLTQLESFQKRLWEKKKFVVSSDYMVTLDILSTELKGIVLENQKQWIFWFANGFLIESEIGDKSLTLESNPSLMVDTRLFNHKFKEELLKLIDDIDSSTNGLLVNSDNYQALNLINKRYTEQVSCIHIDPPYNTATSGFLYKNTFKHSSWLSMMDNRLNKSIPLLKENGVAYCHIDENEYERLYLLTKSYGLNDAGTIIWDKRNPMNGGSGIAKQHEYTTCFTKGNVTINNRNDAVLSMLAKAKQLILKNNGVVTDEVKATYAKWVSKYKELTGGEKAYNMIDNNGRIYRAVSLRAPEPRQDPKFHKPLIHPETGKPCSIPPNGFSRTPETLQTMIDKGDILFGVDETTQPNQKMYLKEDSRRQLSSLIQNAKKGKSETTDLKIDFPYCHHTSLYDSLIGAATHKKDEYILDFFAGSGTSGHAVINLNRLDDGDRKYILIEQGDYSNEITLMRLIKVIFTESWKNGKPNKTSKPTSQIIKLLKTESYEDVLNNLELKKPQQTGDLFDSLTEEAKSDYLLNYMLETESKGSLLSTDDFKKPFDYMMKVSVDSAGASKEKNIDLVETFNYLIGLNVKTVESNIERGYVRIEGKLPSGERALVLWRDCEKIQYDDFTKFASRFDLFAKQKTFDVIYVNGDHNLPTAFTNDEGEVTRTLKLRQIEPEFLEQMFAPDELA